MKEIRLTLFANSTPEGQELASLLEKLFASESPEELKVQMETITDGDDGDMIVAGLRDDIVIFDGSVENDIGSNYKAVRMWPLCMDHFLVVSRTRLPINFQPFHEGGSPDTWGDVLTRPFSLSNQELIFWIKKQLDILAPRLPRLEDERLEITKEQLGSYFQVVGELTEKLITQSLKRRRLYRKISGRAFISYLSCYSKYHRQAIASHELYVEDLVRYIKTWHGEPDYSVLYYPPGSLSSEFMAEYRRWQIVRMIEDRIRTADEFWIFETDDYYNSWWTQSELAALAYIQHNDEHPIFGKCPPPKVFLCKPTKSEGLVVREADSEFIRKLDDKVARELGRCLANTNYYEQIRLQQKIKNLPVAVQWLNFQGGKLFQRILATVGGYSPMSKQEWQKANFREYQSLLKSRFFSDKFWNDRIVNCPNCTSQNKINKNFNFQDFLLHRQHGQFRISSEDLNPILMSGKWSCNQCGFEFQIIREPHPQFRWWSIRWNRPTGPNDVFIEQIPIYNLR
ncbi:MAG: hypothetical protein ACRC1Z_12075 [Waterburya sp.]